VVDEASGSTIVGPEAIGAVADGEGRRTVPHATWRSADHLWSHVSDAALLVHLLDEERHSAFEKGLFE
jgi:hypothetical protein